MNLTLYFIITLVTALVGALAEDSPVILVMTGLLALASAIILVRIAAAHELGTAQTLCVLFFFLAALHTSVGYALAGLTSENTAISSRAEIFYARAMFINSLGLFAGAAGYAWKLQRRTSLNPPRVMTSADPKGALVLFRFLALSGAALMFSAYGRLGVTAYLSDPAKWPFMRYITSDLFGGTPQDEWIVNRAMDLLTVSLPFLFFQIVKRRRLLDIFLSVAGFAALLLPLRRANLLTVGVGFLILIGVRRGNLYLLSRKVILGAGAVYIVSQVIFLWALFENGMTPRQVLSVSSTALPEMRDLGWTLSLMGEERLNGSTFLQAAVPLPSISSDWSARHSLRAVTTRLIGMDQSGQTGGLRLTLMGEAFINFGYVGVIVFGFLWGVFVGWCERLLQAANEFQPGLSNFGAALCFVWACFWVYMAGTQSAAAVRIGLILLFGVCLASRWWRPASSLQVAHGGA